MMHSDEDTLALLSSSADTTETSMDSLLSAYGEHEENRISTPRTSTLQLAQGTSILDDLADILHLRGRLQQMGATFSPSGQLLTYGNPASPTDFESMLNLGPMYEEQWNTFFVKDYVSNRASDANMWSDLRTLKKMLQNEGVVFGREHQRYSFGDSSVKLRRLCAAYDYLRVEWLNMMRTSLPVYDDSDLATVNDGNVQESNPGSTDEVAGEEADAFQFDPGRPLDSTGRMPMLRHRSSGIPQNLGWRFSEDPTPSSRSNAWRFSDNLDAVP
ncbi:hypothetical protein BDW02DRAFT_524951, partial [Decorospora gaudefroyi]